MNLQEAKKRGCPPQILKMLSDAGIKQMGFGLRDGEEGDIDWTTVEEDVKMILTRTNPSPAPPPKSP